MDIQRKDIEQLARLSKMQLTDKEIKNLEKDLTHIFQFVEKLNEVDVEGVPPTSQVTGLQNVMRADIANYDFPKEDIHPTMPDVNGKGELRVHAVFDGDSPSH